MSVPAAAAVVTLLIIKADDDDDVVPTPPSSSVGAVAAAAAAANAAFCFCAIRSFQFEHLNRRQGHEEGSTGERSNESVFFIKKRLDFTCGREGWATWRLVWEPWAYMSALKLFVRATCKSSHNAFICRNTYKLWQRNGACLEFMSKVKRSDRVVTR